jgi:hypothetical protein
VDADATLTWVDQKFLTSEGVRPWAGERSLPLWLPLPEYAGFLSRNVQASLDAGLETRAVADSARDTLAWVWGNGVDKESAGLTEPEETALLIDWRNWSG